jgi:hypothetical protein
VSFTPRPFDHRERRGVWMGSGAVLDIVEKEISVPLGVVQPKAIGHSTDRVVTSSEGNN